MQIASIYKLFFFNTLIMPKFENIDKKDGIHLFNSNLSRVFAYVILLYISINTYTLFLETKESYQNILDRLEEPLITDIKFIANNETCPEGYDVIVNTRIDKTKAGCVCDGIVFEESYCLNFNISATRECTQKDYFKNQNQNISYTFGNCNTCYQI